jgi:hypothetical protein
MRLYQGCPRSLLAKVKSNQQRALSGSFLKSWAADLFRKSRAKRRLIRRASRALICGSGAGPIRITSRELMTFALVRWRSAYVPHGKSETARAVLSRIRWSLGHRRERSQKLSGVNCIAATIQLTGWEPAAFNCSIDRRFGDACGPCCAARCVHRPTSAETPAVTVACSR